MEFMVLYCNNYGTHRYLMKITNDAFAGKGYG